jgi:dolichol-phosphate mannosyltransferase
VLQGLGLTYEIIYVDDGSRDRNASLLGDMQRKDRHVRVLRLSRNFGHQIAVTAGLDYAQGQAVILIDADLQDPPEIIPGMVAKWREGFQVVYGQRESRAGETRFKLWTAHAFYRFINTLSEVPIPVDTGDFRLMDRSVVEALGRMREKHRMLRAMTSWVGYRQTALPYERQERFAGRSKYPLRKMMILALDGIVSFSVVPLRLVTMTGVAFSVLSVLGMIYALVVRLMTDDWVPGWAILFITILLVAGVQSIFLGVIGEYVGRIYSEAKDRPLFLVLEELGFDGEVDRERPPIRAAR